jgi:hypothetical protein
MNSDKKIIFQGQVFYPKQNLYASLIFPIVQVKKFFQLLYDSLLKIIWEELIYGKKIGNELVDFVIFFVFAFLSLAFYYLVNYLPILLIVSVLIWWIDYGLAKQQYLKDSPQVSVTLTPENEDLIYWSISFPNNTPIQSEFTLNQIKEISLVNRPVYGGAFQELVAKIWQVQLLFYDGSDLLIDEQKEVIDALKTAKHLAVYFQVPITFTGSGGKGLYAAQLLNLDSLNPPTNSKQKSIKCHKNSQKWHIYSQWRLSNSWLLFKQIIQESGFLLFVIIMMRIMVLFGQLVYYLILLFTQDNSSRILLQLNAPSLAWQGKQMIAFFIAIALMIFKGWQLSRRKHIYLDKYYLRFFVDNQKLGKIKTEEIEANLLLLNPQPEILIFSPNQAIRIKNFQQQEEAEALLLSLNEALQYFQNLN